MSLSKFSIKAPAKVNLRLKVVGRRPDGFHLLSMLNSSIDLYDQIEITRIGGKTGLKVVGEHEISRHIGAISDNLVLKAANLFLENFKLPGGVSIELSKNIPVGAGLGGGSSDAAATLLAMSNLFRDDLERKLQIEELLPLAVQLGSDVPFFLTGGLSIVRGVGDRVEILSNNPLLGNPALLICPGEYSNTAKVYQNFKNRVPTTKLRPDADLDSFVPSYQRILDLMENDLSSIVLENSKICADLMENLNTFDSVASQITGSGSAIFCLPRKEFDINALNDVKSSLAEGVRATLIKFC